MELRSMAHVPAPDTPALCKAPPLLGALRTSGLGVACSFVGLGFFMELLRSAIPVLTWMGFWMGRGQADRKSPHPRPSGSDCSWHCSWSAEGARSQAGILA